MVFRNTLQTYPSNLFIFSLAFCEKEVTKIVFLLYAVEGYSHKEIGEKLDMAEGTSKWHLSNARKHLKERLHREENKIRKMVI